MLAHPQLVIGDWWVTYAYLPNIEEAIGASKVRSA